MIDFSALAALATSALTPHFHEDTDVGIAVANGCNFPDSTAASILGIEPCEYRVPDSIAFNLGFGFALKLGALLASNPLEHPNLDAIIAEHRAEVAECYTDNPKRAAC